MKTIEEAMHRAWCEYRGMEYVEGFVSPLPSDNFEKGFLAAFKFLMEQHLADRLTAEEREKIKAEYAQTYPDDPDRDLASICMSHLLVRIFGKDMFAEEGGEK